MEKEKETGKEKENEKKRKTGIIVIGVLLILILITVIAVLVVLLLQKGEQDEPQGYVIEEGNYQQIMEEMQADVKEGNFETYMNMEWTFPDGTSETMDAVLGNSPNNTKPIRYEVLLADTEEVIFTTGVIPVGVQLSPFKLDVDLDAGTYNALCRVYLLDQLEDGTYQDYSSAGFYVTITVEN